MELKRKLEDVRRRLKALDSQHAEASAAERAASLALVAAKKGLAATARCVSRAASRPGHVGLGFKVN